MWPHVQYHCVCGPFVAVHPCVAHCLLNTKLLPNERCNLRGLTQRRGDADANALGETHSTVHRMTESLSFTYMRFPIAIGYAYVALAPTL